VRGQNFKGDSQISGVRSFEFETFTGCGVFETESYRMQPLTIQPQSCRERRVGPVQLVSDERVSMCRHVHPDLMSPTRFQFDLDKAGPRK
jgi:hypothetical protein